MAIQHFTNPELGGGHVRREVGQDRRQGARLELVEGLSHVAHLAPAEGHRLAVVHSLRLMDFFTPCASAIKTALRNFTHLRELSLFYIILVLTIPILLDAFL